MNSRHLASKPGGTTVVESYWLPIAGLILGLRPFLGGAGAERWAVAIAPLIPYAIKGAIWYQGESNAGKPIEYRALYAAKEGGRDRSCAAPAAGAAPAAAWTPNR